MKIVDIFEPNLYSFKYEDENEFDRLMELWTDVEYLKTFAEKNKEKSINSFIKEISKNAEDIQDFLEKIQEDDATTLEHYFQPLDDMEQGYIELSQQKGKIRKNNLRLYAIKIDNNCFVITGGAIKMSQKMEEHEDTKKELPKINRAQAYLKAEGIIDNDSFYELLSE